MTENIDEPGRCDAEAGDNADRWLVAIRERATANARPAPPSRPRAIEVSALALAVLAHLLLAWWLRDLMRPQPVVDTDRIEARLLDAALPEPELALPPPSPARAVVGRAPPSRRSAAIASAAPPGPQEPDMRPDPVLRIFNADGSIALPPETAAAVPQSAFTSRSTAPSALMGPHRPLKIRPNHFAQAWRAPQNETLLGEALRKAGDFVDDHLTAEEEFTTPWGSKIKCKASYVFVIAAAGCAWGLPPPPGGRPTEHWKPATELDEQ